MLFSFRRLTAGAIAASLALVLPVSSTASASQRQPGDRCRIEGRTAVSAGTTLRCSMTKRGLVWRRAATPIAAPTTTPFTTPRAPTLVANAPSACETLRLSWSGANPDTGVYSVQWTPLERADFNTYTKVTVRGYSLNMPNWLAGNTTYRFRVFAMRSEWNGTWHSTENVTPHSNLIDVRIPVCASSASGTDGGGGDNVLVGDADTGFVSAIGVGANDEVSTFAIDSSDRILAGGWFTRWNSASTGNLVRLLPSGAIDSAFMTTIGAGATYPGDDSFITAIALQTDGKMLVGGYFTKWDGSSANYVVRLNADGTRDTSFLPGSAGATSTVRAIAVQSSGHILIGGDFVQWHDGSTLRTANKLVRLNTDGTFDATYTGNTGIDGSSSSVYSISVLGDDKALIGGDYASGLHRNIVRLNPHGTVDTSFNTSNTYPNSYVQSIAVATSGAIFLGGGFSSWDTTPVYSVVKLSASGDLDTGFVVTNSGASVESVALQSDGKLLVGGTFSGTWDGTPVGHFVRLNTDGSRDTSLNIRLERDFGGITFVRGIRVQSDDKALIGGKFERVVSTVTTTVSNVIRLQ